MTIFGGIKQEIDRMGGGFEKIALDCPWRDALRCTGQLVTPTPRRRRCKEENCAIWHWLYGWYKAFRDAACSECGVSHGHHDYCSQHKEKE